MVDTTQRTDEELATLVYLYHPTTTPPATNKYTRVISDLLQNSDITDVFPGGAADATALCEDAKRVLERESAVLDIVVTREENLIIVGDIHGQFVDMLSNVLAPQLDQQLPHKSVGSQEPYREYKFLFLGDYVDRGPQSVEVITLLLALKIEYPQHVFLIRGNHEEAQTCRMYGFLQECRSKLDEKSGKGVGSLNMFLTSGAWLQYNMVFCWLPLAAVVGCPSGMFFCAHGGLSPRTRRISDIKSLRRHEYGQLVEPTSSLYMVSPRSDQSEEVSSTDEKSIIDGLLWSDPEQITGCQMNFRGCGFLFGHDVTRAFLDCNYGYKLPNVREGKLESPVSEKPELQFMVRAHQCVSEGYCWGHDGLVLTLFSAPNYCGMSHNKGAIALLHGDAQVGKNRVALEFRVYNGASALRGRMCSNSGTTALDNPVIGNYFSDDSCAGKSMAAGH
ncbi:putative Calcineurin like phosphoesterase [Trypanosoma vivax]|uniref:Serine/threonine-protein phosphatase n=1 Tax=Trypanosoma vivax (strain Y486) TaxID=1055687 RepID=G0U4B9_TRYVY|nr:putative serine/threonine protein phosphatase [Trypanosoma vivax]KAH8613899.1 putative Calcineurin like phosphoesterase [Trypanosoma vivax]CCC47496.1 putative serine/threonine protein phosphatase [Trypanosoma vivax Y486]CCC52282.1 serine/threonine protein phosphatase type 5 [Trypanosoma vivax Y486]CCC54315.1 putative serine/threonine protein phosphatase [Trypanosoma vivax Y486]